VTAFLKPELGADELAKDRGFQVKMRNGVTGKK
jgi:hypothetical protein